MHDLMPNGALIWVVEAVDVKMSTSASNFIPPVNRTDMFTRLSFNELRMRFLRSDSTPSNTALNPRLASFPLLPDVDGVWKRVTSLPKRSERRRSRSDVFAYSS